jgi:hypothetical protein
MAASKMLNLSFNHYTQEGITSEVCIFSEVCFFCPARLASALSHHAFLKVNKSRLKPCLGMHQKYDGHGCDSDNLGYSANRKPDY